MPSVTNLVSRRLMTLLLLALLIGSLLIMSRSGSYALSQSTFELIIQRAKELDQIETLPWSPWLLGQDGADWRWKVQFYDGNQWLPWENERSGGDQNPDANSLNQAYSWVFDAPLSHIIRFRIELWDDDVWPNPPDLADLSSKPGEGIKQWNGAFVAGAVFEGVYNLETMNFTSDSDFVQRRLNPVMGRAMYVASGEFDGTYGSGGLDAEVWFEVEGEILGEAVPSDIAVVNVMPLKTILTSPYPNYIIVDVRNNCSNIVRTYIDVYANTSVISTKYVELLAYQQKSLTVIWQTAGFEGTYIISAMARQISDEIDISNNLHTDGPVIVLSPQKACAIIVAGSQSNPDIQDGWDMNDLINDGCSEVYRDLRTVGLSADRIWYMNQPDHSSQDLDGDGQNDIDAISASGNLSWAIQSWAKTKITSSESLFLYLFDHGGTDQFCIAPNSVVPQIPFAETVSSTQLTAWMNNFEAATGAHAHLIYQACESGSFIDELSKNERVIVTSSRGDEYTYGDIFSYGFWNDILSGHSIGWSFNSATSRVSASGYQQHPLLDDNGDAIGNIGPLPNGGDGYLADVLYIGGCEWPSPWISHAMSKTFLMWPPTSSTTLWAKIENQTSLEYVRAYMQPPDWMPPPNATLVNLDFESYEMADPDHDGNWTVEIASINFTRHATGPALFRFLIDAREINGGVATPSMVSVEFTNGTTPTDNSAPYVFVERPLTEQVVYDQTVVNGTVTDDTCLSRIELWQEVTLLGEELWWPTQTIALAQESTSYFEFQLATANFTNGLSRVFLRAYDTSGNYHDQDVTFLVNHDSHDVAVTNIEIPEVTELGQLACLNVTVANYGSYQESFDLDLYLNMTLATTQAVNLTGGVASIVPMVWNTSDFDLNCYTISCYIRPVSDENNTDNNLYVTAPARALVRLVGDINQDSIVDILDAIIIAGSFSSQPGTPRWNPNADLNSDGIVDIYDAIALVNIYGKTA